MIVYHEGYSTGGAEERVAALMEDPMMLLIDTRKVPYSWRPGWSRDDRCFVRSKEVKPWRPGMPVPDDGRVVSGLRTIWGRQYRWAGKCLGNKNYKGGPIDIIDLNRGLEGIMSLLMEGYTLVLLCECSGLYECHRYTILKALKEYFPDVEIRNADGTPTVIYAEGVSLFGKG